MTEPCVHRSAHVFEPPPREQLVSEDDIHGAFVEEAVASLATSQRLLLALAACDIADGGNGHVFVAFDEGTQADRNGEGGSIRTKRHEVQPDPHGPLLRLLLVDLTLDDVH